MNKDKHVFLRNVLSLTTVQIANYIFPMITVPIVVRIIGPDKYGVINFAAAVITYFILLINFGFDLSATREIAVNKDDPDQRNRIFSEILKTKVFLLIASIIIFCVLLFCLPELRVEKEVAVFSFLICFASVITPNWFYQGMHDLHRIAIFNLLANLLFSSAILLFIRYKGDYVWYPLAAGLAQLAVGIFSFFWAIKKYRIRIIRVSSNTILNLLWSGRMLFFSIVVISLYTTTNTVILGILKPPDQVGYYTAGLKLVTIMQSVITVPFGLALFPLIGKSFGVSTEKGLEMVRKLIPVITLVTGLSGIIIWFLSPYIITIFYGPHFQESINVLRILCFIPMIVAWSNLLGIQTMVNLKMDKAFLRITACGAIIGLGLNAIFTIRWGYIGSAWTLLVSEIFITLAMYFYLNSIKIRTVKLSYFLPGQMLLLAQPIILSIKSKLQK